MNTLRHAVEAQTIRMLEQTGTDWDAFKSPTKEQLHDPFLYKGMEEFVTQLSQYHKTQLCDPDTYLMVRPDYDADGIFSAVIAHAGLSLLNIRHVIVTPKTTTGYGFAKSDLTEMQKRIAPHTIGMILTADNGISANEAITFAWKQGIPTLVTDHHLGEAPKDAAAVVDPHQPGDEYPFKGNSGTTVLWKCLLAYATRTAPETYNDMEKLSLFAGLSTIADVMPLVDENRYLAKSAVETLVHLRKHREDLPKTGCIPYDTTFSALLQVITRYEQDRNQGKKWATRFPENEELVSYYVSPLLNASRRILDASIAPIVALTQSGDLAKQATETLLFANREKSRLRDEAWQTMKHPKTDADLLPVVNTKGGIAGLLAARLQEATGKPALVFTREDPAYPNLRYQTTDIPSLPGRLSASARSNDAYPLPVVATLLNEKVPNLVTFGGHAQAAGMSVEAKDYPLLVSLYPQVLREIDNLREEQEDEPGITNTLLLDTTKEAPTITYPVLVNGQVKQVTEDVNINRLDLQLSGIYEFQSICRPFGKCNPAETKLYLLVGDNIRQSSGYQPNFWKGKGLKTCLFGVDVLVFDTDLAKRLKTTEEPTLVRAVVSENQFAGCITYQLQLSPA